MSAEPKSQSAERIRVLAVAGARPNFMKIGPLMRELRSRADRFEALLVHTGQHYDAAMSDNFFADLGIPEPDFNLGVGSGAHGAQTGQILTEIEKLLIENLNQAGDWRDVEALATLGTPSARTAVKVHQSLDGKSKDQDG